MNEAKMNELTQAEDMAVVINATLGEGTTDLIVRTAREIVIDPDERLRPHLRWQRDACSSERALSKWLSENELTYRCLWWDAAPSSGARMCSILEAEGRAAERLGGKYVSLGKGTNERKAWRRYHAAQRSDRRAEG